MKSKSTYSFFRNFLVFCSLTQATLLFANINTSTPVTLTTNETHTNIIVQNGGVVTIQSGVVIDVTWLTIEVGGKIIVEEGASLDWPATGNANIRDSIIVQGTVNMQGNIYLESNGVIYVTSTGVFNADNSGGSLSNSGGKIKIDNGGEMNIENYQNYGGATIEVDGTLNVNGDMTNAGVIEGSGVMVVDGTTTNQYGGTTFGDGTTNPDCTTGCGDVSLPVTLAELKAVLTSPGEVRLSWETASEHDNDFFTIEKSTDGKFFVKVDQVAGNGTSSFTNQYSWTDSSPVRDLTYYRLSQTDFDGATKILGLRSVSARDKEVNVSFYPNPVRAGEAITIFGSIPQVLKVYNQAGQLVYQAEPHHTRVDLPALLSGVYLLRFETEGGTLTKKLVIQ